ncbi:penicillin-binding protein 2 [Nocardioides anomalus]|uniref:Penicillin-binding protein 2 n=2 Tax=Nocardioides anomalus TaxID=2712223 RepID=A0A6G6WKR4_9ACTN|nr:penicillin-binding protein 2 [Nocardioides anomalus]
MIAMVLSLFGARLVQLQGLDPEQYAAMAAAEGTVDVVLPATRGDILDRNGQPLAQSIEGVAIIGDPTMTADQAPQIAKFLAEQLDVDYFRVLPLLREHKTKTGEPARFEYLARHVPATVGEQVLQQAESRHFEGLTSLRDPVRTYPGGDIGANITGFMGIDKPYGGLEEVFDKDLSGQDGSEKYEVGDGNRIPLGDSVTKPARDGQDLHTTIDRDLQWYAQRTLRQAVEDAKGDSGIAVVMDTRTGEVLALADDPTFSASDPAAAKVKDRRARSLNLAYEPGSVEKVLTLSALIDAGKATARDRLLVPGELDRQDRVIHDHWEHGLIKLTLAGVLAKSSNVGTVLASDKFAPGELRAYLAKFGLGQPTNVGLGAESRGNLPDPALWTSQVGDRIAFGQSLSVNAMQMTAAVNTIANKGVRVDPTLIQGEARRDDGMEIGTDVSTTRRVVSADAARQMTLMMERVVDEDDGVAPAANVPGYRVAGKTGTAQRVVTCTVNGVKQGCYDGSNTVSFAGFAPAEDPRFTVYVVIQNPRISGAGGGSTAGPVFSKLMGYALHRYGVAPSHRKQTVLPVEW